MHLNTLEPRILWPWTEHILTYSSLSLIWFCLIRLHLFSSHIRTHLSLSSGLWLEGRWISSSPSMWVYQVWAGFHHQKTPNKSGKTASQWGSGRRVREWGSKHTSSPLMTVQDENRITAIPPRSLQPHPLLPHPPPDVVCLCKRPWPGGLGWGGSPGPVAPEAWSWTTAGCRGHWQDPAERRRCHGDRAMIAGWQVTGWDRMERLTHFIILLEIWK